MNARGIAHALLLLALLAVRPVPAAAAAALEFWTTETEPERLAVIEYIVDVFEVLNDGVSVKVVAVADDKFVQEFTAACSEGRPPSLVNADSELIVALGNQGFLDHQAVAAALARIGESRFYGGALDKLRAEDGQWRGLPFHGWVQGVWYRKDWFEEAGLAPPEDWQGILEAARSLHDPENGRYGIVIGTMPDHYAEQVFTQIARSGGAAMFDQDGGLIFDSKPMVDALAYYVELAKYAPSGPQTWRARDFYIQGGLAMIFYSSFLMDDLALPGKAENSLSSDNFAELEGGEFDPLLVSKTGMVSVIQGSRKSSYGAVSALGFRQGMTPEQLNAAQRFVEFLFDRQSYITWLHMAPGGMLPVLRHVSEDPDFMRDPAGVFNVYGHEKMQAVISGLERTESFAVSAGGGVEKAALVFAEKIIPRMIHDAVFNGMAPETAVRRAQEEIRGLLE